MLISLTGADPENCNCGVSALAISALCLIMDKHPDDKIVLLDYYKNERNFKLDDKRSTIERIGFRFSWKPYRNNLMVLIVGAILIRLLPLHFFKEIVFHLLPHLKRVSAISITYSICGGDSFSDIYGIKRFIYVTLPQILFIILKKRLIQLPQTYGPYNSVTSRIISKFILKRSEKIFSRDLASNKLLTNIAPTLQNKITFCYDLAFTLKPKFVISPKPYDDSKTTVGLNINGLLMMGGYSRSNQFELCVDYQTLCYEIIFLFIQELSCRVVLFPHVFGTAAESDLNACLKIFQNISDKNNISIHKRNSNPQEVKGAIGYCDFFIGSRMHACIAAISQYIPTVSLAYSHKFESIMESVGLKDCTIDLRKNNNKQIIDKTKHVFKNYADIKKHLSKKVSLIKKETNLFSKPLSPL